MSDIVTTNQTADYFREMDRRTPRINFRLPSPELRRQLEEAALAKSTTISGYIRALVLEALRKEQELREQGQAPTFFG